jgi:hypothetical protein
MRLRAAALILSCAIVSSTGLEALAGRFGLTTAVTAAPGLLGVILFGLEIEGRRRSR